MIYSYVSFRCLSRWIFLLLVLFLLCLSLQLDSNSLSLLVTENLFAQAKFRLDFHNYLFILWENFHYLENFGLCSFNAVITISAFQNTVVEDIKTKVFQLFCICVKLFVLSRSTSCSQEPSTGPYPEPYQSNPLHPILLSKIHFTGRLYWEIKVFLKSVLLFV
jgi:hypothetical protein